MNELEQYTVTGEPEQEASRGTKRRIWTNGLSCFDYRLGAEPVIRTEGPSGGYAQLKGNHVDAFAFNNEI